MAERSPQASNKDAESGLDKRMMEASRGFLLQGHTYASVHNILLNQGYAPSEAKAAVEYLRQHPPQPPQPKESNVVGMILLLLVLCSLIGLGLAAYYEYTKPICGNKILERGETQETCCRDAGCPTGESCKKNVCTTPNTCRADADCDDGNAATTDTCSGTPSKCSHV